VGTTCERRETPRHLRLSSQHDQRQAAWPSRRRDHWGTEATLRETPEEFEAEARLLLAVKLCELGRVSTGRAAELAGLPRVEFLHALHRFKVSPFSDDPDELDRDVAHALG
jgi:predicted HTH domain antitoxin